MTALDIRDMTADDLQEVCRIEALSFSHPWSEKTFANALCAPDQCFLCAFPAGKSQPAAFGGYYQVLDEADILNIAVHPDLRGQGIGAQLLEALIRRAAQNGVRTLHLEVRQSNTAAITLYRKFHFVQDGLRPRYYTHPTEDAILMSCAI